MSEALDKSCVPNVTPGTDLTKLPIGAREGFLLSRIDGRTSVGELAAVCGFPADEVERLLTHLIVLRAAYIGQPPVPTVPPPRSVAASEPVVTRVPPSSQRNRARQPRSRRWDACDLDEPVELELELKTRILDLHTHLDDLDHYELLDVPRTADRKAIKSAYYALASVFHTDRYFGRQLGSFKSRMEVIFGRITIAHDVLANKAKRVEYDAYLVDRDRTRAFERYLAGDDPYEPTTRGDEPAEATHVDEPPPATMRGNAVPIPSEQPPPSLRVEQPTEPAGIPLSRRREALARRLVGSSTSRIRIGQKTDAPVAQRDAPPVSQDPRSATEALKRRYHEGRDLARRVRGRRMIEAADEALAKDDLLTAANNYRLALGYDDDPALRQKYEDVNRRARVLMADAYLKQARYEEQAKKWTAAAISYAKAHESRPEDPRICERAANALRMEGRDLHKAARFAEMAVQNSPSNIDFRITLGAVYLDAGLFLRARSELEHAAKIDPKNTTVKDLLARARTMAS